jgi:biotin carboxylase
VTRSLLVVGSTSVTPWGHDQLVQIAKQARLRGLRLVGMDLAARLDQSSETALFDELVVADVDDADTCTTAVAGRTDIAAVLTIRELSVAPVAAIARSLRLRGNDPAVVERIREKDRCRAWLRDRGFNQPLTRLCSSVDDAVEFMGDTGAGPWIVKPRDGLASIGVSLVRGSHELAAAVGRVDRGDRFLIESFVDGDEFSAEGVMIGGRPRVLALTRKIMGDGPGVIGDGFVETGHRQPEGLPDELAARARDDVTRALTVTGVAHGIFHVEFWSAPDAIVLGELHDRGGGDFIHLLVEHTHPGLNMYGLLIDDLLGRPAAPIPPPVGAAAATFPTFASGTITEIDGWSRVQKHPRVVACDLQVAVGDTLAPATGSYDRPAVIVVKAPTPEEVQAITDDLVRGLVISVRTPLFDHRRTTDAGPGPNTARRTEPPESPADQ